MYISIPPVQSLLERKSKRDPVLTAPESVDSKVSGLVLRSMSHSSGGLPLSVIASRLMSDLIPGLIESRPKGKRKIKMRKMPVVKKAPIGLHSSDPEGWVNAIMQFILFIPGFADSFIFAPKYLEPFVQFIEQYILDQEENRSCSNANGIPIFRFQKTRWPSVCLYQLIHFLIGELQTNWVIHEGIDQALQKERTGDIFIKESGGKQFFTQPDAFLYDLDAFIEKRVNEGVGCFVTYVKFEGSWYQCDQERITLLRSNSLSNPLRRSILLHYRRVTF